MKKNYLKPKTESTVVNMEWAMCQQPVTTGGGDNKPSNPGSVTEWPTGAPKKRVF